MRDVFLSSLIANFLPISWWKRWSFFSLPSPSFSLFPVSETKWTWYGNYPSFSSSSSASIDDKNVDDLRRVFVSFFLIAVDCPFEIQNASY